MGRALSENPSHNRATIAIIYYNSGQLASQDGKWVAWPKFVEAMSSSSSLEEGLKALKTPFILSLLTLYGFFRVSHFTTKDAVYEATHDSVGQNFWDDSGSYTYNAAYYIAHDVVDDVIWTATADTVEGNKIRGGFNATGKAAYYAVRGIVYNTAYDAAYTVARDVAQLSEVTPENVGKAAAEVTCKMLIENQAQIEASISRIGFRDKDFDPLQIVNDLLRVDLSLIIPRERCYYLYMISVMLQNIPTNRGLSNQFDTLVKKYGCGDIFADVVGDEPITSEGLNYLTSRVGEEPERALRALIGEYLGRPPTKQEVMQRLLQL